MRLALLIISIIFLSCCRIAHAQIENLSVQYTGIWSGSYICGSTESGITLVLTPDGPNSVNGTLSYYPLANRGDVTPGSHHVRIKIKDNSFVGMYGAWIQRPPKHRPLEFTGLRISEDQLSFDINSPSCKTATLTKFEGPPDRVPRVVEKEDRTAPKVAKSAQPQQNAAGSSFAGRWEGPATCLKGPHKFILSVLPAIDKSGFNASLTVVSMAEVKADDVTVQGMFINDSDPRSPIRFEPDRHAKLPPRQSAPSFKGRADGKGQLRGASHESGCQVVSLKRLSQDPYGEIANRVVPPDLTGFLGHWDGAIFDREGRAFQVSFSITPAQSGSVNRMFDVTVELNNRVGKIALAKVPNGSLNIVNILGQGQLPVALRGHLLTDLVRSSGRDHFVFATQGDANGTGIVWRRPPARGDISLKRECEEDVIPFATARNHAREIARDLRMEYFPALSKYDEAAASMREALKAYSDKGQTMAAGSFALLAAQCMLTSPNFYFYLNRELMAGIVDMEAIEKARLGFA